MNFFVRTLLTLAMVSSAMIIGVPQAMAQKKDAEKCPAQTGGTATLNIANDPNTSLDVVGTCNVTTHGTYTFDRVTVKSGGSLLFSEEKLTGNENGNVIEFAAKSIVVQTGGTLQAGTAGAPIGTKSPANQVVIRMLGDRPTKRVTADDCSVVDKGIAVMAGGTLHLYGAKGVPSRGGVSWTHLSAPAGPSTYEDTSQRIGAVVTNGQNGRRIQLARSVTDGSTPWRDGDWIVIATTSYSPFESEFAQIEKVSGTEITLKTPLKHYHFGGLDPGLPASAPGTASASFAYGKDRNYGVDERAEVGLISRNIRLTADTADGFAAPTDTNRNWGGETKFCSGFKDVALEGVEIEKFGKEALGSYPIHLHMAGDVKGRIRIAANSVHHSYNKCVAIHMTSSATFEDNVCARITGHVFYQEIGDEADTGFTGNLVVGAMNNSFGLEVNARCLSKAKISDTEEVCTKATGYWEGDNKAVELGFTGLGIDNKDGQGNPVHGSCYFTENNTGLLGARNNPPCSDGQYYVEPPTGFWIIHPSARLEGNSVAGCQGQGRGYWYVPPTEGPLKFQPVGTFRNNRAHGCYDGIFAEGEEAVVSGQLFPKVGGVDAGHSLFGRFEGFTASRIRNRAVWMRPAWNVFENARIATSREGVALVTSGGLDGNTPGVWGFLRHAVIVAISTNNVDRWGPCADSADLGSNQELSGCVAYNKESKEFSGKKYPGPNWNFAGFYIYDGPMRIHDTRFVRYQVDPRLLLTKADEVVLDRFMPKDTRPYEGDAALGWFAANPSAYPTATEVKGLQFEETNLRHQIFTDKVNLSGFLDGDKNTAVLDRDGTLTGFRVLDKDGKPLTDHFPISLNNLPFNSFSNAVDECLAEGGQDKIQEKRATSLISPGSMATLEFGALQLPDGRAVDSNGQVGNQSMTFTRDSPGHASMTLTGRNSQGIWEPKVASGLGYTIRASSGIPNVISVGLTDVVKPRMNEQPFYARIGVCYSDSKNGVPPNPKFQISRGYRSWGGGNLNIGNPVVRKYYNQLANLYNGQFCQNLDAQARVDGFSRNLAEHGCPANGVVIADGLVVDGKCPGGEPPVTVGGESSCIYATTQLSEGTFEQLAPDGKPDVSKYYYDKDTGMLFFYVVQNEVNAQGPSPLGNCMAGNDPACPESGESFYGCPAQGCTTYRVEILDSNYAYGPSACGGKGEADIYAKVPKYVLEEPADKNQLGYAPGGPSGPVIPQSKEDKPGFPYRVAMTPPICTGTP